jgi:hypothetical protein
MEIYRPTSGLVVRMVGTMKPSLRKFLGQSVLTEEDLNTALISIETAVNSRPIAEVKIFLHFLIREGLLTMPTGSEPTERQNRAKDFRLKQKIFRTNSGNFGQEITC